MAKVTRLVTILTAWGAWDYAERKYGSEGLWLGRRSDGSIEIRRYAWLLEVLQ